MGRSVFNANDLRVRRNGSAGILPAFEWSENGKLVSFEVDYAIVQGALATCELIELLGVGF